MVYRMVASIVTWVATTLIVLIRQLNDRDLAYALGAATASTIAIWWSQPQVSRPAAVSNPTEWRVKQ